MEQCGQNQFPYEINALHFIAPSGWESRLGESHAQGSHVTRFVKIFIKIIFADMKNGCKINLISSNHRIFRFSIKMEQNTKNHLRRSFIQKNLTSYAYKTVAHT